MSNLSKYSAWQLTYKLIIDQFNPAVITPVYLENVYAGSEITVYAANKIYLVMEFWAFQNAPAASTRYITLYNELNAVKSYYHSQMLYWNATAAAPYYEVVPFKYENFWFSRVVSTAIDHFKLIGFRLTL